MAVSCLPLILLLFGGITAAPLAEVDSEDEDVELLLIANAGLEGLHPRQVIEGDIMLDAYTRHLVGLEEKKDSVFDRFPPSMKLSKKAVINKRSWPNGIVPYVFGSFLDEDKRNAIHEAIKEWEEQTCIKFVPRKSEKDYVTFVKESEQGSCRSYVGKSGGSQKVWVGSSYCNKGQIMHELGHVIGFYHEHTRPDRDKYVEIKWENINKNYYYNFEKYDHGAIDSLGVPYDYDSIMHYGKRTGGVPPGAITILPKTRANVNIGQRTHLSIADIKQANLLYKCKEKLNIQNGYNGFCIQASLTNGEVYILSLTDCNQSNSMQQWRWNDKNQLYNPATLKCISIGPEGLLELRDCTSGDTACTQQQWLCANHYIEHPCTGNCITVSEDSHQLVAEPCAEEKSTRQKWNKFKEILTLLGDTLAPKSVEPICTVPGYHTITKCYKEDIKLGWSVCNRLGYYVKGLSHARTLTVTEYFNCCFTPHVFTGEPGTPSRTEEICVNETWWFSNTRGWFKCPMGYYLKGYFKEGLKGWHADQQVRCCKAAQGPSFYQHCRTNSTDVQGLHQCPDGYHIAGVYNTDCSQTDCVEDIYCCT